MEWHRINTTAVSEHKDSQQGRVSLVRVDIGLTEGRLESRDGGTGDQGRGRSIAGQGRDSGWYWKRGAGRRTRRYVGRITHLQPMELITVAEDVGSDEGEQVREMCAYRYKSDNPLNERF